MRLTYHPQAEAELIEAAPPLRPWHPFPSPFQLSAF